MSKKISAIIVAACTVLFGIFGYREVFANTDGLDKAYTGMLSGIVGSSDYVSGILAMLLWVVLGFLIGFLVIFVAKSIVKKIISAIIIAASTVSVSSFGYNEIYENTDGLKRAYDGMLSGIVGSSDYVAGILAMLCWVGLGLAIGIVLSIIVKAILKKFFSK